MLRMEAKGQVATKLQPCKDFRHGRRVPAIDRALDLLEMLGVSNKGFTLSEVSRTLGIAISSAHYLVYTLTSRGYVRRDPDGHHFKLGPRAFDYANLNPEESSLRGVVSPYIEMLGRELGMIALLGVRRGSQVVIVDKWAPSGSGITWISERVLLHSSALGKAVIAQLSEAELDMLFRGHPLPRVTPNTITSLSALKAHLAQVKAQGFAVNNEEDNIGWKTVAAPIFNHVGEVIASACAQAPSAQMPDWRIPKVAERVISAATNISRALAT